MKLWREKNPEKVRAQARKDYHADPQKFRKRWRAWADANPDNLVARSAKRRASKLSATPRWANPVAISRIYKDAAALRKDGYDCHVDHIVPLQSQTVCGLHTEANLQILHAVENIQKSNRVWPDMPDFPTSPEQDT